MSRRTSAGCGRDCVLHVAHVDAIACEHVTFGGHGKYGQARHLLDLDILGTGNRSDDFFHRAAAFEQLVQVVAEQLDRNVRTDACNQLVHPHLHRLGELIIVAGDFRDSLVQFSDKLLTRFARIRPVFAVFQHDKVIRNRRRHRIGCNIGCADLGKHPFNLWKFADAFFERTLHVNRLAKARAGNA